VDVFLSALSLGVSHVNFGADVLSDMPREVRVVSYRP